jgi:hypothetical protein
VKEDGEEEEEEEQEQEEKDYIDDYLVARSVGAWQRRGGGVGAVLVVEVCFQFVVDGLEWLEVEDVRRNPCPGFCQDR